MSTTSIPTVNHHSDNATRPPLRILVIGAGARGHAYASAILHLRAKGQAHAVVAAIAEPDGFRRGQFGARFVDGWTGEEAQDREAGRWFTGWEEWVEQERVRRAEKGEGEDEKHETCPIDGAIIAVLDHQHRAAVEGLLPLKVHILCEKPLTTSLADLLAIERLLRQHPPPARGLFAICHVLRYSPHNKLLHQLLIRDRLIGDILSIEHTEPIGWWHFAHSYVRGNWRSPRTAAPSLLTKSCHDIDFLLWLLSSPSSSSSTRSPHLPATISSTGALLFFKPSRKPPTAGGASTTNCLRCPAEPSCKYSAKALYLTRFLRAGAFEWPTKVAPDIEDVYRRRGPAAAESRLLAALAEDYGDADDEEGVESRNWYGRCVFEAGNGVVDDQVVTIGFDEEEEEGKGEGDGGARRGAKIATFHMTAFTEAVCARRGRVHGVDGEVAYDSARIEVVRFATGKREVFVPEPATGGHGGGDEGLVRAFLQALGCVRWEGLGVLRAEREVLGCEVEEVLRSHAVVWAAEEARVMGKVVRWREWWEGVRGGGEGGEVSGE